MAKSQDTEIQIGNFVYCCPKNKVDFYLGAWSANTCNHFSSMKKGSKELVLWLKKWHCLNLLMC